MTDATALLEEFRDAVAAENEARAVETGSEAAAALIELSDREAGHDAAARLVWDQSGVDGADRAAARTVVERMQTARNRRAEFGVLLQGLSAGNFDRDEALSVTDSVIDALQAADEAVAEFRETDAFDRLNPLLISVTPEESFFPKGNDDPHPDPPGHGDGKKNSDEKNGNGNGNRNGSGSRRGKPRDDTGTESDSEDTETRETVAFTLTNLGGTAATEIDVDLETTLPDASLDPTGIDRLDAGAEQSFALSFDSDIAGDRYRTRVSIESAEGAAEVVSLPIVVVDKRRYLDELVRMVTALREQYAELESKTTGPIRPVLKTLDRAADDLDSLRSRLESDDVGSRSANQELFRIKQNLKRLYGLTTALKGVPSSRLVALEDEVDEIRETIASAREAEL